jgi:general stress protein YciG
MAGKNPHAVALGSLGGKARAKELSPEERTKIARGAGRKSAKARMEKLSPERRREIARKAGKASAAARAKKARGK